MKGWEGHTFVFAANTVLSSITLLILVVGMVANSYRVTVLQRRVEDLENLNRKSRLYGR